MSKKITVEGSLGRYEVATANRIAVEREVSKLGQDLRERESALRQLKEEERRALAMLMQAVEDGAG